MKILSRISAVFAILFLCLFCSSTVVSATGTYADIYAADLEVLQSFEYTDVGYYYIVVQYNGDLALPQKTTGSYATQNVSLAANDGETDITLFQIAAYEKTNVFALVFNISDIETTQNFTLANGQTFEKRASVTNTAYSGIIFAENIIFQKSGDTWLIQTESTVKSYSVALNTTNVQMPVFNSLENRLQIEIALPYTIDCDVMYTGDVSVISSDGYTGVVTAYQSMGENTLILAFENSEKWSVPTDISLSIQPCVLTFENIQLSLIDEITFYGYSDGGWLTENLREIKQIINGEIVYDKISWLKNTYTLPTPIAQTEKIFIGWNYADVFYKAGDTIVLTDETVRIEAAFVDYALQHTGAVCYNQTGVDASGLRFIATLDKADYEKYQSLIYGVGILVMPTDLISTNEFMFENYLENAMPAYAKTENILFGDSDCFELYASIIRLAESNYNRSFSARAFLLIKDGDSVRYVYADTVLSESMYDVALRALNDENTKEAWQTDILETFVQTVNV